MRLSPYTTERTGNRVLDKFQDVFAGFVRTLNGDFITSDRRARRQFTTPSIVQWAAGGAALAETPIFHCPFDLVIKRIAWVGQGSIAANGANFRTFQILRRRSGNSAGTPASRATSSNGNSIAAFVPFDLTLSTDANVLACKQEDVLCVALGSSGGGSPAVGPGVFVIDYELLREVGNG